MQMAPRHMKRYQDIDELLKAGIDIYTTLDIQHIESIQDTVSAVMGPCRIRADPGTASLIRPLV